ncbi:MAG: hypothetical protein QJT81_13245 [Candidatus Thiothrix putei]|uniref:Uncharacterized protein n=1 Tax=Candidatus Thiothrix putei TaxID=3080811 RepID=A0AA95H8I8_9GAMM|nr:MAG: hypothetical protein QJT81_13245 [Candidatus Thiothrix putei]
MTDNEYQSMAMSQYMLREFREQCKQQQDAKTQENTKLDYQQFDHEVLTYPIFSNHACGNHDAKELLKTNSEEAYCERWRVFYEPDPWKLPQINYQKQLDEQLEVLKQSLFHLNSPRLILFMATFIVIILLVMRGHFLLPSVPILALAGYWYASERKIRATQQLLGKHLDKMQALDIQKESIAHQLESLPPPAMLTQLNTEYQQAVAKLFHNTLLYVLPPAECSNLSQTLRQQRWEGFIMESWGYLQLPLAAQQHTEIRHTLLDDQHIPLVAMQDDPYKRKGYSVYRVQYLHLWILTQRGLLMGRGYFDRVAKQFLYEQQEFYPYAQLSHLELTEQHLPEEPLLKQRLPEHLYQRYFQQAVSVMSIKTVTGKSYECAALPVSERPFRQTEWQERYRLDTDIQHLNRCLHQRMYGLAKTA